MCCCQAGAKIIADRARLGRRQLVHLHPCNKAFPPWENLADISQEVAETSTTFCQKIKKK